jgi:hypothetical protein
MHLFLKAPLLVMTELLGPQQQQQRQQQRQPWLLLMPAWHLWTQLEGC